MSSILDALNKLEQEKAQAARENEQAELDPAVTAHDLVGRSVLRDRVTLRITPAALLLSVGALMVTLVVVVIAVAMIFARSGETPAISQTSVAANTPVPVSSADDATSVAPALDLVETPPAGAAAVAVPPPATAAGTAPEPGLATPAPALPSPQAASFVPASESAAPPVSAVPAPVTVARQPEPKPETPPMPAPTSAPQAQASSPVASAEPPAPEPEPAKPAPREPAAPDEESAPPTRVAAAPPTVEEEDAPPVRRSPPAPKASAAPAKDVAIDRLPIFTPVDQMRYGFDRVTINIMKPADATNPRGSAILSFSETSEDGSKRQNRMRFYEGERIQQSPLRMFKVEKDRVGIEDVRTGDRYQLQF